MLTVYLVPKHRPRYIPSPEQFHTWLTAVQKSYLARSLRSSETEGQDEDEDEDISGDITQDNSEDTTEDAEEELSRDVTTQADVLSLHTHSPHAVCVPDIGVAQLFDQDAHDSLLPAELTFEQLRLESAPHPTFLPLREVECEISCRGCGDLFELEDFDQALDTLQIVPLEKFKLYCPSCHQDVGHKDLIFDIEVAFVQFWITIEECGTTRLNPSLIKTWGDLLGCNLSIILEQRAPTLDWAGGEEVTWAGAVGELEHMRGEVIDQWLGEVSSQRESRRRRRAQSKRSKNKKFSR